MSKADNNIKGSKSDYIKNTEEKKGLSGSMKSTKMNKDS